MTITGSPADSARPDETESQRRWMSAMQDAQQQILAKKGVRVSLTVRTGAQKKAWADEATERRLSRYFSFMDAVNANRINAPAMQGSRTNPVYPDRLARHYHGD